MSDLSNGNLDQQIRLEALKIAIDGVGKIRFSAYAAVTAAQKFAAYIATGTVPEEEVQPERPPRLAPVKTRRGTTGEGG